MRERSVGGVGVGDAYFDARYGRGAKAVLVGARLYGARANGCRGRGKCRGCRALYGEGGIYSVLEWVCGVTRMGR